MNRDPWLDRWLPLIRDRVGRSPVLELGCGDGADTEVLVASGQQVVAVDLSPEDIAKARARIPSAEFHCQDIRAPLPMPMTELGVVIASLSLHYFSWDETLAVVSRIHRSLRPSGVFVCRLNSTNDHHHGASGHPKIAHNYYHVNGKPKRFFDEGEVAELFKADWQLISCIEMETQRCDRPKWVWEIVAERPVARTEFETP